MNREQKAAEVEDIAAEIGGADAVFAVDYRGINVAQVATLREQLRGADTKFRIVKNSLTERAVEKAGVGELRSLLIGPTALALVRGDAATAAKVLSDTARELRGPLAFKGGLMDGAILTVEEIQRIARLPSLDVLHGQLVGMVAAPLTGLARTLNALIGGLAVQLGQLAEQGLVGGGATAPAADAAAEPPTASSADSSAAESEGAPATADELEASAPAETTEAAAEPEPPAETEIEGASDDGPSDE